MISANELKKILQIQEHYNDVEYLEEAIDQELVTNPIKTNYGVAIYILGDFNIDVVDIVATKYMTLGNYKHIVIMPFCNKGEIKTCCKFYFK